MNMNFDSTTCLKEEGKDQEDDQKGSSNQSRG